MTRIPESSTRRPDLFTRALIAALATGFILLAIGAAMTMTSSPTPVIVQSHDDRMGNLSECLNQARVTGDVADATHECVERYRPSNSLR